MLFRTYLIVLIATMFPPAAHAQVRDSVQVTVSDGTLYGVLTSPKQGGKAPVALILSDAGGSDRNGNQGIFTNDCLKALSDSLAKRGIASIRFDKRGVGRAINMTDESRLRFSDYAMDVIAWGKWIRRQKRWSRIVIIGHGEGALVGALAANDAGVDGLVSLLGPAESADTMVLRQVRHQGLRAEPADTLRSLYGELRAKGTISMIPAHPFYAGFFRTTVLQYLYSWMQYQPLGVYSMVKAPILFIAGSTDLQQDSTQCERIRQALPASTHIMIAGMNHVLRTAPKEISDNMDTYYQARLPLSPGLLPPLIRFIRQK